MSDSLHSFVFERIAVRGAFVALDGVWRFVRSLRVYPPAVAPLLGEAMAACALLASTLKRSHGSLLLQMQGDGGDLELLLAECSSDYGLRATARWREGIEPARLDRLIGKGRCVITLGERGGPAYQGVVPLERSSLAAALEDYMGRSEQLESRIVLGAEPDFAGGMLLQRVPDVAEADADAWNRVQLLAATVRLHELRSTDIASLLRKLFPTDDVRLFPGRALRFACSCSPERVRGMLRSLGAAEVEQILAEQGKVEVTCEFCGQRYTFTPEQCRALFTGPEGASREPGA